MKSVISVALAGLIAAGTVATTAGNASAGGGYWHGGGHSAGYGPWKGPRHPPGPPPAARYHSGGNGNWGAAVAGGAILGLALGAVIASEPPAPRYVYAPPPPPPPAYAPTYAYEQPVYAQPAYPQLSQAHVDWCAATYPNYQPATDTYLASNGVYYRCVGPY